MAADEVTRLKAEIADLVQKLEIADQEKTHAGQLGLQLVHEKAELEQQVVSLQESQEHLKQELEGAREALNQFRADHRNATISELHSEASYWEDKIKLEEEFGEKVKQLEDRLKSVTVELERTKAEADRLQGEFTAVQQKVDDLTEQRQQLKEELKELKDREQRLLNENNELEDENVNLQKQVSTLKAAQVEYEALKVDVTRIMEENEALHNIVEEAKVLQQMAERQTEDALQTAQHEREQRLALKKEVEQMRNNEQMSNLNNLYMSFSTAKAENDETRLHALESSIIADGPIEQVGGQGVDLFSEIHGTEINKVKEEKEKLSQELNDLSDKIKTALAPLLQKLQVTGLSDSSDLANLKDIVQSALVKLEEKLKQGSPDKASERKAEQIKADLRHVILLAGQKNAQLAAAQDRILHLGDLLAQFYAEIASGEDEEQHKKVKQIQLTIRNLAQQNQEPEPESADSEAERDAKSPKLPAVNVSRTLMADKFEQEVASKLQAGIRLDEIINEADRRDKLAAENEDLIKSFDSFQEIMKVVKQTTENIIQSKMAMEDKDKAELCQQISKLKSLLSVKREQVSSLRSVLRNNKGAHEDSLKSLMCKYGSEKKIKDATINELRKELKQFKEDAATFASNRAMFTARNEELQAANEQLRAQLNHVEEEKKTLNQLLRMSIQQKLNATQRVEELEIDRERLSLKRPSRPAGPPQQQREVRAVRYPQSGGQGNKSNNNNNNHTSPRTSQK